MSDRDENPILILGMHRSGTSALTGCLRLVGVELGGTLLPPNSSNEAGHFENQDVLAVHEILLRDLGCRWDMIGSLPPGWEQSEAADRAATHIVGILERQFVGRGTWAVKDPRMSRLMPVWFRALSRLELQPRFVLMLRHPLEVARSLEARDGIDLAKGHLLWLVHTRGAAQACCGHPHAVVTYEQLLGDPVATLGATAAALGITLPRDPADHAPELVRFTSPALRHHHAERPDDGRTAAAFADFASIYDRTRVGRSDEVAAAGPRGRARSRAASDGAPDLLVSPADRSPAATLLRGALDLLGTYERKDLDAAALRERRLMASTDNAEVLVAQVYLPGENGGPGPALENAQGGLLLADEWQSLEFEVPRPALLRNAGLRLDPLNTRGVVSIASLGLFRATDDREIWCATNASILEVCSVAGDAFAIPGSDSVDLVCTGSRPHLLLPALPELPDVPLRLRIWLKPSRNQALLASHWARLWSARENLEKEVASALSETESLRAAVKAAGEAEDQRAALAWSEEAQRLRAALASSQGQAEELRGALASSQEEAGELRTALASSQDEAGELRAALASSRGEVEELRAALASSRGEVGELRSALATSRGEVAELRATRLDALELKRELVELEGRFREQTAALSWAEAELEESRRSLARAEDSLGRSAREKELLVRSLRGLQRAFEAVMTTRRWRLGDALVRGYGTIRFRRQVPTAVVEANAIFTELERSNVLDEEHDPGS